MSNKDYYYMEWQLRGKPQGDFATWLAGELAMLQAMWNTYMVVPDEGIAGDPVEYDGYASGITVHSPFGVLKKRLGLTLDDEGSDCEYGELP